MNWDLASYFREFNGEEMQAFKAALESDIQSILMIGICFLEPDATN